MDYFLKNVNKMVINENRRKLFYQIISQSFDVHYETEQNPMLTKVYFLLDALKTSDFIEPEICTIICEKNDKLPSWLKVEHGTYGSKLGLNLFDKTSSNPFVSTFICSQY